MLTETVQTLINQFTGDLNQLIETEAETIRERISGAIAGIAAEETIIRKAGPVLPPLIRGKIARKPRAVFLCLRKNCKNVGAPIYGMVCTKHKDTPKATIAKLKARRAARAEK